MMRKLKKDTDTIFFNTNNDMDAIFFIPITYYAFNQTQRKYNVPASKIP